MAWYEMKSAGLPSGLQNNMDSVLNKKFGTSTTYPPTSWPDTVNLMGPLPEKTVSGAIASFSDGADDVPIKSASFGIMASGGGGTPSTPVPIVGKSSVTVFHGKKNFFIPYDTESTYNGVKYTPQADGGLKCENTATAYTFRRMTGTLPKGSYTLSGGRGGVGLSVRKASDNTNIISQANDIPAQFTLTEETEVYFVYYVQNGTTVNVTIYAQVEAGSTATTYEKHVSATTYTATLGQTVYGGTLDSDGTLTLTHGIVDLGDLSWTYDSANTRFNANLNGIKYVQYVRSLEMLCDSLEVISDRRPIANVPNYSIYNGAPPTIHVKYTEYTDKDLFKSAVTGMKLVYPLETPIVVTGLDEISLSTYLGDNTIWCDSGDSEVTYRADIALALAALQGNRSLGLMTARPDPEEPEEDPEKPEER